MADYEFSAKLNATGVEQTLRSMEDWVARLTNNSVGSFGRMEKALLEIAKSSKAVETALSKVNKVSYECFDSGIKQYLDTIKLNSIIKIKFF